MRINGFSAQYTISNIIDVQGLLKKIQKHINNDELEEALKIIDKIPFMAEYMKEEPLSALYDIYIERNKLDMAFEVLKKYPKQLLYKLEDKLRQLSALHKSKGDFKAAELVLNTFFW